MGAAVSRGSSTQQEPIAAAGGMLRSGRPHRYTVDDCETSETALIEREFADRRGARHRLACASGGCAMRNALPVGGLRPGEPVLTNAFTLSPVRGAIAAAGGRPVLVETTEAPTLDLDDLAKIEATGARLLLISHMRGRLADMDALTALLARRGVALIENCARTMGAARSGRRSGGFGAAVCFSAQTCKHLNAGGGGLLTTDGPRLMARAVILSGSNMLYDRHLAGPPPETYPDIRLDAPNCRSERIDDLRAAILRPQFAGLDRDVALGTERHRAVEAELAGAEALTVPQRPTGGRFVGGSIQFLASCLRREVELKWRGYAGRRHLDRQRLPRTGAILARLFDMRIPLAFSVGDCRPIGRIIRQGWAETAAEGRLAS